MPDIMEIPGVEQQLAALVAERDDVVSENKELKAKVNELCERYAEMSARHDQLWTEFDKLCSEKPDEKRKNESKQRTVVDDEVDFRKSEKVQKEKEKGKSERVKDLKKSESARESNLSESEESGKNDERKWQEVKGKKRKVVPNGIPRLTPCLHPRMKASMKVMLVT